MIRTPLRFLLSGLAVFSLVFSGPLASLAATTPMTYSGWIPFWEKTDGALDAARNMERLGSVSPFSFDVRPDGTIIDRLLIEEGFWEGWISAMQLSGVKVIPTAAWFDGPAMHALLTDKKKRIALEDRIKALVLKHKFDGIDIDFEAKLAETSPYFSIFLYGMSIRLKPYGKKLVCTLESRTPLSSLYVTPPPEKDIARANDYVAINKYCDEVRFMAYDQGVVDRKLAYEKGNGSLYAPVADPDWARKVLGEALKSISPKKIMLGAPTYGYEWQVTWANGFTYYERLRSHTYVQAMARAKEKGVTPTRNNAGELSYTYTTDMYVPDVRAGLKFQATSTQPALIADNYAKGLTTRFVSFPDAESATGLIALARELGIKGVVFFKFDGDQDPMLWSVMAR
jgi:spore germination protein YaaH